MIVGVALGDGVTVGAAVLVEMTCGAGVSPPERNVNPITTITSTTAIISIRKDGNGGRGRLVGAVAGGCTSGIAPTTCIDASSVACTWPASSFGLRPMIVPN